MLGFLVTYSAIPVPTTSVHSNWALRVLYVFTGLCSPWVAVMAVAGVASSFAAYTATELRFGSLLAVLVYLFLILTWKQSNRGLLNALVELRRDVSLRHVDVSEARGQAILAVKGMYAIDVLQIPLREVLGYIREASNHQATATRLLEGVRLSEENGDRQKPTTHPGLEPIHRRIDDFVREGRAALDACEAPLQRLKYYERILDIFESRLYDKSEYLSQDVREERDRILENQLKLGVKPISS